MQTSNTTSPRPSRSPNGCNGKPVMVALTPAERTEIETIASVECRSMSASARWLMLKGLAAYRKDHPATGK